MRDLIYSTGLTPATPEALRGLAYDVERWRRDDLSGASELEARICAALWADHGWEYVPPKPYVPAVKQGRKIVERERFAVAARIGRRYSEQDETGRTRMSGGEESPAPKILRDIGQAFGLLRGRVLLHLSDITADGLPMAHVGGGKDMRAEGKGMCAATLAAALVAAILRCEAMDREAARDG